MIITLIGYRGSGKSTVAAPLAETLGWSWIDADSEIEGRHGRSIRDIFDTDGELHFRQLEREVLSDLLKQYRLVIAAGGGAALDEQTRSEMIAAGPVVWLEASVDTLEKRIAVDQSTAARRPDLTAGGGRREIEQLLTQREPSYRQCATLRIKTDDLTVDEIVERIMQSIGPAIDED